MPSACSLRRELWQPSCDKSARKKRLWVRVAHEYRCTANADILPIWHLSSAGPRPWARRPSATVTACEEGRKAALPRARPGPPAHAHRTGPGPAHRARGRRVDVPAWVPLAVAAGPSGTEAEARASPGFSDGPRTRRLGASSRDHEPAKAHLKQNPHHTRHPAAGPHPQVAAAPRARGAAEWGTPPPPAGGRGKPTVARWHFSASPLSPELELKATHYMSL